MSTIYAPALKLVLGQTPAAKAGDEKGTALEAGQEIGPDDKSDGPGVVRRAVSLLVGKQAKDVGLMDGLKAFGRIINWRTELYLRAMAIGSQTFCTVQEEPDVEGESGKVASVIDGNTFVMEDGQTVDLIGVVIPPEGERCFAEAKADLNALLMGGGEGKTVRLESDPYWEAGEASASYYVHLIDKTFVNERMLALGSVWFDWDEEKRITHADKLIGAEKDARDVSRGCLWGGCVKVVKVIDGDTFKYDDVRMEKVTDVRILGIGSPESTQKCFDKTRNYFIQLIGGEKDVYVRLTKETNPEQDEEDNFERELRYVSLCEEGYDPAYTSLAMLSGGMACTFMLGHLGRAAEFVQAALEAKREGRGCWADFPEFCLDIEGGVGVNPAAVGEPRDDDDGSGLVCEISDESACLCVAGIDYQGTENPVRGEYVALGNRCNTRLNLVGWEVYDRAQTTYPFSAGSVPGSDGIPPHDPYMNNCAGAVACRVNGFAIDEACGASQEPPIRLYTGQGTNTDTEFYWGRRQSVWNQDHDDIILKSPGSDNPTATCSY